MLTGRQTRAFDAIAEDHSRSAGIVVPCGVHAIAWPCAVQRSDFSPERTGDSNIERRAATARRAGADSGQRWLLQNEMLIALAGVATAQQLADGFAVGRGGDVRVDCDGLAVVAVAETKRQVQVSAIAIVLDTVGESGNECDLVDGLIV